MEIKGHIESILNELSFNLKFIDEEQLNVFKETILKAGHIFTAGAGRSGVAVRAFTNRLMQLGFSVSMVGEISSPHSQKGDLLIIGSGSGETESLIALAQKAKKNGVKIALVTMDAASALGHLADISLILPGVSPKQKTQQSDIRSIQPMGSSFEQLQFLTYDGIILELMSVMDESSQTMFLRHADFE